MLVAPGGFREFCETKGACDCAKGDTEGEIRGDFVFGLCGKQAPRPPGRGFHEEDFGLQARFGELEFVPRYPVATALSPLNPERSGFR